MAASNSATVPSSAPSSSASSWSSNTWQASRRSPPLMRFTRSMIAHNPPPYAPVPSAINDFAGRAGFVATGAAFATRERFVGDDFFFAGAAGFCFVATDFFLRVVGARRDAGAGARLLAGFRRDIESHPVIPSKSMSAVGIVQPIQHPDFAAEVSI